ncbi:hypothetical protein G6F59_016686 [Rhizopus arrhizus]|nr:hypothetical protein G6F59_016686 [Rhizopus arrhizus]
MTGARFRHLPHPRRSPPRHQGTPAGFLPTSALTRRCWTTPSSGSTSACHAGSWRDWMRRQERRVNRVPATSPIWLHWAEQARCRAEPRSAAVARRAMSRAWLDSAGGIHAWRGSAGFAHQYVAHCRQRTGSSTPGRALSWMRTLRSAG